MDQYKYNDKELAFIESSNLSFAIYQFINKRVVTIALTQGFCTQCGFKNLAEAYYVMDNNMYRDAHPDDIARIADAAIQFATNDTNYNVLYRSKIAGEYHIIHARGEHIYKENTRLALIWYFDEGKYNDQESISIDSPKKLYSNLVNEINLFHKTNYDYLTGLPSMMYFFELAEAGYSKMIKLGENPVMLFFDFICMKYFNNKYGFTEGNNLIKAFAQLLIKFFSLENCCRFGMDRFCAYTNDKDIEKRLWDLFSETENLNNGKSLPVRVGIYNGNMGGVGASFACDRAKIACDINRSAYASHFNYFDEDMLQYDQDRLYIINNIDRAIEEHWIKVYYQPIIRASNDMVCDEEALSRWIDPQKGFLTPDKFIPILEESNLIYKLDLYVTEQILEKMQKQANKGLYIVPISVNLSRSDFDTCDIVSEIQKRVDKFGISHDKLTIEITESIIGSDFTYMKSQIERFMALGFKIWMDDFGSGYSSMNVLQDIHFNLMKIDMKFMQQFYTNEKSKIILTELIRLAQGLEIETIVEGVETEEQVAFLKEIGCTKLQGFYYCRPIPPEQIFERYENGTQIGFENPAESEYYASLGRISLYDLSVISTNNSKEMFHNYFNTLPMTILELNETELKIIRSNKSYRVFLKKYFQPFHKEKKQRFHSRLSGNGETFIQAMEKAKETDRPIIINESLHNGTKFHVYIRKIAVNNITNVTAFVVVVLGISETSVIESELN